MIPDHTIPHRLDHPLASPPAPTRTQVEYENAKEFTESAFKIAKYPFFLKGVQALTNSSSTYPYDRVLGAGMVILSPIGLLVNLGAAAAAGGGAAYAGAAKAAQVLERKSNPSEYQTYLAEEFVNSLYDRFLDLSVEDRERCRDRPERLVGTEVIAIAFLSRDEARENALNIGGTTIQENQLEGSSADYFKIICKIKNQINALHLSPSDDSHAWNVFLEEAEQLNDHRKLSEQRFSCYQQIDQLTKQFAELAVHDKLFTELWKEKIKVLG